MAWQDMDVAQVNTGYQQEVSFQKEIELTAIGISDWIIIPDQIQLISVTVSFSGGAAGKMQTTTNLVHIVKTGNPVPIDWDFGVISEARSERCKPVTAMRAEQTSPGVMSVSMRAQ